MQHASELMTEYMAEDEIVTRSNTNTKNVDHEVYGLPIEHERNLDTTGNKEKIQDVDDNREQVARETEQEDNYKISDTIFDDQHHQKVFDAEPTNFISDDGASWEKESGGLCSAKVSTEENVDDAVTAEETKEQSSEIFYKNRNDGNEEIRILEVKQSNEQRAGICLYTEKMANEELDEGNELIQEEDSQEVGIDNIINETNQSLDGEEHSWEDKLEIGNVVMCEKIVISEHNAVAEAVLEKNHEESQKNFDKMDGAKVILEEKRVGTENNSYKPAEKDEKVVYCLNPSTLTLSF